MKKLILLLLSLILLNSAEALDLIGTDFNNSIEKIKSRDIQILNINTSEIYTIESTCIIIYYYKDNICNRIEYLLEDGFYKDNLLRKRLIDYPYELELFVYYEENKIISVYQIPYIL